MNFTPSLNLFPIADCRLPNCRRSANQKSEIGNRRFVAAALILGLLCVSTHAKEDAPQRDFGFQPLEIFKFDNGTSRLIVDDINGDGAFDMYISCYLSNDLVEGLNIFNKEG